jgi:DNA-binding NtrC family response regulator
MKLAYYLEDNELQREVMLDILNQEFRETVHFVSFSSLDDLRQAYSQNVPSFVLSDLDVADANPKQTIEFLKELVRNDIPVVVVSGQINEFAWDAELAKVELLPKGSGLKVLKEMAGRISASLGTPPA